MEEKTKDLNSNYQDFICGGTAFGFIIPFYIKFNYVPILSYHRLA